MWLCLINSDVKGIKKYSEALGVGSLYWLLACMMTARSWEAIASGMDKSKATGKEVSNLQTIKYLFFPIT